MKRRTMLAGVLPFLQGGRWLDQMLLVNQGEIVEKRFIGIAEGETTEIASIDDDGTTVSSEHEGQLGQSPREISTEVAASLRGTYDTLRFHITVAHHGGSLNIFGRTGLEEYRTSRALYSGVAVGNHISFQTSLLNRDTIISLSCLADEKEALQRRCQVGVEDPTAE
ncbi:hypothetical protein C437_04935 [Haloarcula vallismortis ATCC 29715]|uniref:Uncharacterized protein n=2 Tax=Haloarcula vallismortis TaxID=28442 RepID=M0JLC5_HALVA|nr:hypothetical protein C437_04935 [Haloarcula vallismortis ATCC 29715]